MVPPQTTSCTVFPRVRARSRTFAHRHRRRGVCGTTTRACPVLIRDSIRFRRGRPGSCPGRSDEHGDVFLRLSLGFAVCLGHPVLSLYTKVDQVEDNALLRRPQSCLKWERLDHAQRCAEPSGGSARWRVAGASLATLSSILGRAVADARSLTGAVRVYSLYSSKRLLGGHRYRRRCSRVTGFMGSIRCVLSHGRETSVSSTTCESGRRRE